MKESSLCLMQWRNKWKGDMIQAVNQEDPLCNSILNRSKQGKITYAKARGEDAIALEMLSRNHHDLETAWMGGSCPKYTCTKQPFGLAWGRHTSFYSQRHSRGTWPVLYSSTFYFPAEITRCLFTTGSAGGSLQHKSKVKLKLIPPER